MNINPKEFEVGQVAYYVKKNGYKCTVEFGTVLEHYPSCICLQLYDIPDKRLVDGIPVSQIKFPTNKKKLPKGWTYNTELFILSHSEFPEEMKTLKYNNSNDIKIAIEKGYLVKVQDKEYGHIETEIDKDGWNLHLKYPYGEYHPSYISLNWPDVYQTYGEAKAIVDAYDAEFKRQSELSDYDWSVEQIDKTINRCIILTKEEKEDVRNFLLSQKNIEDIETRLHSGHVQWKYEKNKRWMNVPHIIRITDPTNGENIIKIL